MCCDAQPDQLEQLADPRLAARRRRATPWMTSGSPTISQHRHARVERRERVLEDDLHLAADRLQLRAATAASGRPWSPSWRKQTSPLGRLRRPQDQSPGRGLAAAGLADQAERLALVDLEADAVDGLDLADHAAQQPALDREVLLEVAHLEQDRSAPVGLHRLESGAVRLP